MHCGERTQNCLAGFNVAPSGVQVTTVNLRLTQEGEQLQIYLMATPAGQSLEGCRFNPTDTVLSSVPIW